MAGLLKFFALGILLYALYGLGLFLWMEFSYPRVIATVETIRAEAVDAGSLAKGRIGMSRQDDSQDKPIAYYSYGLNIPDVPTTIETEFRTGKLRSKGEKIEVYFDKESNTAVLRDSSPIKNHLVALCFSLILWFAAIQYKKSRSIQNQP
jgi:hypothetical protein